MTLDGALNYKRRSGHIFLPLSWASKRLQSCKESLVHRGPLEADITMHHSEISPQTDWNVRNIF